jgi:hypothetical protein
MRKNLIKEVKLDLLSEKVLGKEISHSIDKVESDFSPLIDIDLELSESDNDVVQKKRFKLSVKAKQPMVALGLMSLLVLLVVAVKM